MRNTLQEFLGTNTKHLANFEHTWIFQICFNCLSFGTVGGFSVGDFWHNFLHTKKEDPGISTSAEQCSVHPGWLFDIGDEPLPTYIYYMGIIKSQYGCFQK